MILGVVSDTHNHLSNVERIIDIFNEKNVGKVIHTGDITQAKTLSRFSRLNCPLIGVYGNNDLEEKNLKDTAEHQQIYRANEDFIPWKELDEYLNLIKEAESSSDHTKLRDIFVQTVSGYETEKDIVDVIYLEKSKNS